MQFKCVCGFQNLVGTSVYGEQNLLILGWNRVGVHMPSCPQAPLHFFHNYSRNDLFVYIMWTVDLIVEDIYCYCNGFKLQ